jgi:hypothetical protein
MNKKLLTALLVFSSLPAFAGGGSSIGDSLCSFAAVSCHTNEASPLEQTWVCVFENGGLKERALVTTPSHLDGVWFEGVQLQPIEPGKLGAPQIYSSSGLDLEYVSDAAERPGYLTVPSLDLRDLQMSCN